jgi:hypothetical protein
MQATPNDFLEMKIHRFNEKISDRKRGGFVVIRTFPIDTKFQSPYFHEPGQYFGEGFPLPFLCHPFITDRVVDVFGFHVSVRLTLPDLASYVRNLRDAGCAPANDWYQRFGLRPNLDVVNFDPSGQATGEHLRRYSGSDLRALFPRGFPAGPTGWYERPEESEPVKPFEMTDDDVHIWSVRLTSPQTPEHRHPEPPQLPVGPPPPPPRVRQPVVTEVEEPVRAIDVDESTRRRSTVLMRIASGRLNRNDPCFCGSGKRFKRCCLTAPDQDVFLQPGNGQVASLKIVSRLLENIVAKRD